MFSKKNWNRISTKMGLVSGAVLLQFGLGGECFPDNYFSALSALSVDTAVGTAIGIVVSNLLGA